MKFNANLVQQATYATTFNVYDVAVSTFGDIICCGSDGTSSSGARQGSINLLQPVHVPLSLLYVAMLRSVQYLQNVLPMVLLH